MRVLNKGFRKKLLCLVPGPSVSFRYWRATSNTQEFQEENSLMPSWWPDLPLAPDSQSQGLCLLLVYQLFGQETVKIQCLAGLKNVSVRHDPAEEILVETPFRERWVLVIFPSMRWRYRGCWIARVPIWLEWVESRVLKGVRLCTSGVTSSITSSHCGLFLH